MDDPHLAASLAVLEELYDSFLTFLHSADDDCLNWTPPLPNANSIAALTHHVAGSLNSWLARALDETVARSRDAEFGGHGGAADLIAIVETSRVRTREQFARLAAVDRATVRRARRSIPQPHEVEVSVGWCIEHAIVHAGEHWGQMQLNLSLYHSWGRTRS